MKQIADIPLAPHLTRALENLRRRLLAEFEIETMILYGSVARGEADEESDQDVLVVTIQPVTDAERDRITRAAFEVNLRHDTSISTLVVDRETWETGAAVCLLRDEILRDGIAL